MSTDNQKPRGWIVHTPAGDRITDNAEYVALAKREGVDNTPLYAAVPHTQDPVAWIYEICNVSGDWETKITRHKPDCDMFVIRNSRRLYTESELDR